MTAAESRADAGHWGRCPELLSPGPGLGFQSLLESGPASLVCLPGGGAESGAGSARAPPVVVSPEFLWRRTSSFPSIRPELVGRGPGTSLSGTLGLWGPQVHESRDFRNAPQRLSAVF